MPNTPTPFKETISETESDFRRMCDNSPIFIWMSNAAGTCFFFNKAWRGHTGQASPENTDRWFENIHTDERESVYTRFKKHFAARTPYRAEYRLRRYDGVYRWVISHASPYYDSHNRFAGFISACFDFNDQHEFENTLATRALKQTALAAYGRFALEPHKFSELTREAVKIILETLHVDCAYLASLNRDTLSLTLEASACRLGKTPPRELGTVNPSALTITRATQLADDQENFPLSPLLVANGIRSALMCPVGTGKQLYGYLFANTRSIRTFSPEAIDFIQGLANTLATVHQRDQAEKALADSEQKLLQSQKVEAIGLLAGGIAHDFNNLLTAIRGYTDLLQKDIAKISTTTLATQALRTHAIGVENAAIRASKLVRQLLTFSRSQTAQTERIDINTLVLELKDLIAAFLRSGIQFEIQTAPDVANAYIDRTQLEQVVLNLAINSRDAMPDGGRLTINVATEQIPAGHATLAPGPYTRISVTDTGTGIPPEAQAKLFTPFFTTKPKNRGTGLGLPTCANIVKNARGKITFETIPEQGTTFIVLLPDFLPSQLTSPSNGSITPFFLDHDNASALPNDDEHPPASDDDTAALPTGTETIILVEDDPAIREVTTAILESLGYTVHPYSSGETLLAQYASAATPATAHLLITDINMPGINGRQLAERIRAQHPAPLRVIFISGFINETLQKSGEHYLEKPFTRDILAQKVREALDN